MSLATRCTECQTTFKVVQDQLKVSRGWVRCGHCQQVFNALENMFDIDEPSAAPVVAPSSPSKAARSQAAVEEGIDLDFPSVPVKPVAAEASVSTMPSVPIAPEPSDMEEATTQPPEDDPISDADMANLAAKNQTDTDTLRWANLIAEPSQTPPLERSLPPPSQRRGRSGTRGRLPPPVEPTFVKQAEREAIWQHPVIKALLGFVLLGLLLLLAGQVMLHWRNDIAARIPATQAWLAQLCRPLHCTVTAPQNLKHLQVESVTIVKVDSRGPNAYQLTVLVRNSGDSNVQWPLLDLTLTDINGQTLTRRNLSVSAAAQVPADDNHGKPASQFWPVPAAVEPGLIALQWQLQAPNMTLAGYTAELFYP